MPELPEPLGTSRRQFLKLGATVLAAGATGAAFDLQQPPPVDAQTPKRGGIFRLCFVLDPVGFDPHLTLAFTTMTMLSFTHSRLVKVKAGPSVRPGTYPLEPDVAESWTQPNDITYIFKLRRGVRWHPKPPVNGRELTADDVKYTYDRFLTIKGNGNRATLEQVDHIEALDRYTVKFTLKEPFVWFLDMLASTSTWLVAHEAVEKFGDLKRAEAVIGTGPWMLERYDPNVKLTFLRNPHYFMSGLPYADGVEVTVDVDPSSRVASWLAGSTTSRPSSSRSCAGSTSTKPSAESPGSRRPSTSGSSAATHRASSTRIPSRTSASGVRWVAPATGESFWRPTRSRSAMAPRTQQSPPPRPSGRFQSINSRARGANSTTKTFAQPSDC